MKKDKNKLKGIVVVKVPTEYMIKKYGWFRAWDKQICNAVKRSEKYL